LSAHVRVDLKAGLVVAMDLRICVAPAVLLDFVALIGEDRKEERNLSTQDELIFCRNANQNERRNANCIVL
jgi:hypothetical protein